MQEYEDVKAGADSKVKRSQGTANARKEGHDHPSEKKKGMAKKMGGWEDDFLKKHLGPATSTKHQGWMDRKKPHRFSHTSHLREDHDKVRRGTPGWDRE